MRTIKRILESLLDADFDIDVDDVATFGERGYICTKCNYSTQLPMILLSDRLDTRCKQAGVSEVRSVKDPGTFTKPSIGWLQNALALCVLNTCYKEADTKEFISQLFRFKIVKWSWKQTGNQVKIDVKFDSGRVNSAKFNLQIELKK